MAVYKSDLTPVPIETKPFGERLLEAFWNHAVRDPEQKAMISGENPNHFVTWKEMYLNSLSVAAFLEEFGFGHGDMAVLVLPNCWEFVQLIVGAALRGGAVSGASTLFTDYELERQFKDSKAKIVFAVESSLDRVLKAVKNCPRIRTIVVVPVHNREIPPEKFDFPFGVLHFSEVTKRIPNLNQKKVDIDVHRDILVLPYSSGTTGSPKGVMLSHKNFSTMISIYINHYDKYVYSFIGPDWEIQKKNMLLSLPFYHIYGIGVLMGAMIRGQTGILMTHFDKNVYCRCIQDFKIKILNVVPPIMVVLASDPVTKKYDLSSLEVLMSGAAPAGNDLIQKLKKVLPSLKRIDQGYGMTECSMATSLPYPKEDPGGNNVGKLLSNFEMKIINEEGKTMELGEVGQLCLRSPTFMMGYLGRPQATAEAIDDEGWYHTGDIARMDSNGFIYVVDRLKELIKVKGYQVAPAEIEDLLLSHPDILDAAVIGILDEKSGEVPKAFVVRKSNLLTEDQVKEFVASKTAPYKHIKEVEFINEIPKSAAGKILRRFLRDKARNLNSKI
ncbi:hypothetical protein FO519_003254 [Halicephalobus sp. NKZ332]|nr:hypothetical protein FO519_003254 [Halicephalobus sp. NKZ332]